MESKGKVTFMNQEYENSETGEKVRGITVIIDGALKGVLDKLIAESPKEADLNYTKLVQDALFRGINELIEEHKQAHGE